MLSPDSRIPRPSAIGIRNLGLKTAGSGTPVRLRETVEDVKVWVKDADGEPVAGEMDLYEGWYCLELESG